MIDTTARVWIGCLACYNEGNLRGDWFAADEAGEVTSNELHFGPGWRYAEGKPAHPHEELWVMDHEGLPIEGECSPAEAQLWADLLNEVDEHMRPAFLAWVDLGSHSVDGDGMPSASEFEDVFCGEWASFREYADEMADEMIASRGPHDDDDLLVRYFDWESFARDLAYDYNVADAPGSGVFIFRSL